LANLPDASDAALPKLVATVEAAAPGQYFPQYQNIWRLDGRPAELQTLKG
jgi:hypothetical protein